jgi:hypothetical protein
MKAKNHIWLQQPLLQIILYIFIYELLLMILEKTGVFKMNLSIGITSKYLFYLFIFLSIVLSIILFITKVSKLSYAIILALLYIFISILIFGIKTKLLILILFISAISILSSHFLINRYSKK